VGWSFHRVRAKELWRGTGLIEDAAVEGADQANSNAQAAWGAFFLAEGVGMFEGGDVGVCGRWNGR
jgi:hypothetical protein